MEYLSEKQAKKAIIDIGKRMYVRNFVAANDGNISVKTGDNEVWATPTGVSKGYMKKKMLVKVDLDGNILEGTCKPSSELKMHLRAYQENEEIRAVCHAHPPVCTCYAIAGIPLTAPVLAEAVITLGDVPIAPYAKLGSREVPEAVAPFCHTHNGILLANHGAVTWAEEPYAAWYRLESMEYYANILLITEHILGRQNLLTDEQVGALLAMREKFGIKRGGVPTT
ncbi:MAG: class II aldolase/adducin family protein [Lachnospiraceae bacterium]|jgi:L-fuculose-phosphate aldolase|nr:class II aldolase/adducin family protein [Lachnospiraceae bacterium]MCI8986118.1 class II aldolase/adducin family protein [Lachnospiraceae bacterium]